METSAFPDFGHRPDWWTPPDPITAITHNITGQCRREMVREILSGDASRDAPNEEIAAVLRQVEPELLADCLAEHLFVEGVDPRWMGGEYLPSYRRGEIEIARLISDSATMDVVSFRARRVANGRIHYRAVDEYESDLAVSPTSSRRPLSLAELIGLIDSLTIDGCSHPDQDFCTWALDARIAAAKWQTRKQFEECALFYRLESPFYPALELCYATRFEQWLESRCGALGI